MADVQDSAACADHGFYPESGYLSSAGFYVGRQSATGAICELTGGNAGPRGRGPDAFGCCSTWRSGRVGVWFSCGRFTSPKYGLVAYCRGTISSVILTKDIDKGSAPGQNLRYRKKIPFASEGQLVIWLTLLFSKRLIVPRRSSCGSQE